MDLTTFLKLPIKEMRKIMLPVIAAANRDQRRLVKKYEKLRGKKALKD